MVPPPKKNWFARNWFWFVPIGCVGMLCAAIGFLALIFMAVFAMMKSSDAYKDGVAQAKSHPAVQAALGTPIEEGMFVMGNIDLKNDSGEANLSVPLSGPAGDGTLHIEAIKSAGQWTFNSLVLDCAGERIDLLAEAEAEAW